MGTHFHAFLTSLLGGGRFTPDSVPDTDCIGCCVRLRAGLVSVERKNILSLSRFDPQFRGRPAQNLVATQTLLSPYVSHLSCLYGYIIGAVQLRQLHGAV